MTTHDAAEPSAARESALGEELFRTPRTRVRRITPDDEGSMFAVYGDADAMRWVGDGKPLDRESCRRWIDVTANNYRERGYGMAAIEHLEWDVVIGFCGLVHPGGQTDAELKYALHREYWGGGYASEVALGMLRYGAQRHGLRRIIATVAAEHTVSQRVLEKIGMHRSHTITHEGGVTAVFVWSAVAT